MKTIYRAQGLVLTVMLSSLQGYHLHAATVSGNNSFNSSSNNSFNNSFNNSAKQSVLYREAVDAFNAQHYRQALVNFLQLQEQGNLEPGLRYNTAVCFYKLGRLDSARAEFSTLLQEPGYQWWVQYNIALVDKKLGRHKPAAEAFLAVARQAGNRELAVLAAQQYRKLEPAADISRTVIPRAAEPRSSWLGGVGLAFGYDDNVIDPTDLESSDSGDGFTETVTSLSKSWDSGWRFDAVGYFSRYSDVADYDIDLVNLSLAKSIPLGDWQLAYSLETERSSVGSNDYLQQWATQLSGRYSLDAPGERVSLRYKYTDVASLFADYDALEGSAQRFEVEYRLPLFQSQAQALTWQLRYRLEQDDRADEWEADSFSSYSALRNGLRSRWVWQQSDWEYGFTVGYRHSGYLDDNQSAAGVSERREDRRLKLALQASYLLSEQWSIDTELSHTDNDSTVEDYRYSRTALTTGINWSF